MTAISPGDEITVTITGTLDLSVIGTPVIRTPSGATMHTGLVNDPDVKVTVLRPDRPTRREVLEQHEEIWVGNPGQERYECYCGDVGNHAAHLDAVLTKWEEN